MGDIRDAANATYPDGPGSSPTPPQKSAIRALFGTIEDRVIASASGLVQKATWSTASDGLESIIGARDGQPGRVTIDDPGTHFDDILGALVLNAGEYSWNAAVGGWQRVGDLAASKEEVDEIADKTVELEANLIAPNRATITPYRDATYDTDDAVVEGIGHDGNLRARLVEVPVFSKRDVIQPLIPVVTDLSGRPAIGLRHKTGDVVLKLDPEADTYLPASMLRGGYDCFNIRPAGKRGVAATIQDGDGYTYDVFQQKTSISNTALALASTALELILWIGQSNAGAGSGAVGGPIYTEKLYPHHAMQIGDAPESGGNAAISQYWINKRDLSPYQEPTGNGQSPAGMFLEALNRFERDQGLRSPARVCHTSWEGSTALSGFFPAASGHYNFENAQTALVRAKELASAYPVSLALPAVFLVQGESGPDPYADMFNDWIDDVPPLFAAAVGQTAVPKLLFAQTSTDTDVSVASGVFLDQLAVARSRTSPAVSLVTPMYPGPLHDVIHLSDLGRMMIFEIFALVYARVRQGLAWNPLWPVAGGVTRSTNVITIPMTLPPGSTDLALDDDWVQSVTARGFKFSQTGGNSPVIQSVEIVGTSIVVTLDITPTGTSKKISYAKDNNTGTTGWATGRGQVYARTNTLSTFNRLGFAVPKFIRHYCVRFEETFS